MVGLCYLVSRQVIEEVLICTKCGEEVLRDDVVKNCSEVHQGKRCKCMQKFGWVVLRIGKLKHGKTFHEHELNSFMLG